MSPELRPLLDTVYGYARRAQATDSARAEAALAAGEMPHYFDLSLYTELADVCWAREAWDEARHWYRHNAAVTLEKRAWHVAHSGPDYPMDALSATEASTLVRAGHLRLARDHLRRAIAYWEGRSGSDLVLSGLGLHAAQAGLADAAALAARVVAARDELPGDGSEAAVRARALLHYEPAQAALLLGRWEDFLAELERLEEGARIATRGGHLAFPAPQQHALVATARGLRTLASLRAGEVDPHAGREAARRDFETAMVEFHRFGGQIDWHLYFMRLDTRLADDLAEGREPDPNPFADDGPDR